ncbi:unnamed protein product [Mesocestoides corti]|nr:unnamed protein product [Mesocestoides corti]
MTVRETFDRINRLRNILQSDKIRDRPQVNRGIQVETLSTNTSVCVETRVDRKCQTSPQLPHAKPCMRRDPEVSTACHHGSHTGQKQAPGVPPHNPVPRPTSGCSVTDFWDTVTGSDTSSDEEADKILPTPSPCGDSFKQEGGFPWNTALHYQTKHKSANCSQNYIKSHEQHKCPQKGIAFHRTTKTPPLSSPHLKSALRSKSVECRRTSVNRPKANWMSPEEGLMLRTPPPQGQRWEECINRIYDRRSRKPLHYPNENKKLPRRTATSDRGHAIQRTLVRSNLLRQTFSSSRKRRENPPETTNTTSRPLWRTC